MESEGPWGLRTGQWILEELCGAAYHRGQLQESARVGPNRTNGVDSWANEAGRIHGWARRASGIDGWAGNADGVDSWVGEATDIDGWADGDDGTDGWADSWWSQRGRLRTCR